MSELRNELETLSELIFYGIASDSDKQRHSTLLGEIAWLEYEQDYNGY